MRFDCHVHSGVISTYGCGAEFDRNRFLADLQQSGFDGCAVYSPSCSRFSNLSADERMKAALDICGDSDVLFPFYWINPLEEDALSQVDIAIERGFVAFKMIPSRYNVACRESMDVIEKIAKKGKPIMFHSGICWDGVNSAANHRPANYEALIEIPNLKFCLAHVSWPWYDECIAVYGKFNNAYNMRSSESDEMFIDLTPGTPRIYREEVFRHLLCCDYEMRYNLMFGTDSSTEKYNVEWSKEWQDRDDLLYNKFVSGDIIDFKEHVYGKNFLRFIGKSDEAPTKKIPLVGQ